MPLSAPKSRLTTALRPLRSAGYSARVYWQAIKDRRPKIAYVGGWLGKDNLGDELLFSATSSLVPDRHLLHYRGGRTARGLLSLTPNVRCGIFAGGTLIGQKRSWLQIAREFLDSGRQLVIFGSGVEEACFWPGAATIADWIPVLERCAFVGLRGPISAQLLQSAGFDGGVVVGDPVLTLARDAINLTPEPRTLALNLGVSDDRLWGTERSVQEKMTSLAARARAEGWTVKWYVVWPKDLAVTRAAAAASGTAQHIHVITRSHTEFMDSVRTATAFVGMKLHATALATCALTPSIMLEYRPKCRDYMQAIGQDRYTYRTDAFEPEVLWEVISHWSRNRAPAAHALAGEMAAARRRQAQAASQLREIISSR